jgi:hypothetical protein
MKGIKEGKKGVRDEDMREIICPVRLNLCMHQSHRQMTKYIETLNEHILI